MTHELFKGFRRKEELQEGVYDDQNQFPGDFEDTEVISGSKSS